MVSPFPVQSTPFIGREAELARLLNLLEQPDARLITILGAGGVGKTRLAFAAAATIAQGNVLPVFSVILDAPQSREQLSAAIANAIGCTLYGDTAAETQLLAWMNGKRFLLLLDNFEHAQDGAGFLMKLLNVPSEIHLLVTSRERLGLRGETAFALKGFSTSVGESVETALTAPAVRLFVNAAQHASAEFELKDEHLAHVSRICRRVEGLPLAIELAAAWVDTLSVREIADEIETSYTFLSSDFQDLPERHRSILATFESSWKRLSPDKQDSLMRMSVFRGGFTRQAALAVTGATIHTLQALVNRSLLKYGDNERYVVHELLRQYLSDKLSEAGQTEAAEAAHSRYFLDGLRTLEPLIQGHEQRETLNRIEQDFANVRFAWDTAFKRRERSALSEAIEALFWFCMMRTHYYEGEELLERVQTLSAETPEERLLQARARLRRLWMERWRRGAFHQPETIVPELETIRHRFEAAQCSQDIAICLLILGDVSRYTDDPPARAQQYLARSLELSRASNNDFYAAWALHFMGRHALITEGLPRAIEFQQESLALRERCGDANGVLYAQFNLGEYFLQMGDFDHSTRLFERMLERSRETGERSSELMSTALLSLIAFLRADLSQAADLSQQTLIAAAALNHPLGTTYATLVLGLITLIEGKPDQTAERLRALESAQLHGIVRYWANLAQSMAQSSRAASDSMQDQLRQAVDYATTVQGAGVMAWCLPVCALVAAHEGHHTQAASLLALSDKLGLAAWAEHWSAFSNLRTSLENTLSASAYENADEAAQKLDLATALESLVYSPHQDDSHRFSALVITANQSLDEPLSDRELEVLALIAQGLQNAEIAAQLVVEMSTIKKHVGHIYGKLGVTTRAQAMVKAQQQGLV